MRLFTKSQLESPTTICLLANTPNYLYKHLRADPAVMAIADATSVRDLEELFRHYVEEESGCATVDVPAYVALVALSLKASPESQASIESLSAPQLRWFEDVKRRATVDYKATNVIALSLPGPVVPGQLVLNEGTANQSIVGQIEPRIILSTAE